MKNEISLQLAAALASFGGGFAAGAFYDVLRVLRKLFKHLTAVCDLVFWAAFALFLFIISFLYGKGELRIYMLFISCAGACVYFLLFGKTSRAIMRSFGCALEGFKRKFRTKRNELLKKLKKSIEKKQKNAKKIFHSTNKWYKIKAKKQNAKEVTVEEGDTVVEDKKIRYFYESSHTESCSIRDSVPDGALRKNR